MSMLTKTSRSITCPPEDTYTLEIVAVDDFEDRPAFKQNPNDPNITNRQARIAFVIREFEYDPEVDERDWNGERITDYFVFQKIDENNEVRDTWLDERSNAYKLVTAVTGIKPDEMEDDDTLELQDFVGERIRATIKQKASGHPKVAEPSRYKRRKAKPKPVEPDDEDTEENPFSDEAK